MVLGNNILRSVYRQVISMRSIMKIITLIFNIVLFVFTCFVLVTDGLPKETSYIIFTLWTFLILILNVVVISRNETSKNILLAAIIGNIILVGLVCWAIADQYPHPMEPGVVEFGVLMVLTPILSLILYLRNRKILYGPVSKNAT